MAALSQTWWLIGLFLKPAKCCRRGQEKHEKIDGDKAKGLCANIRVIWRGASSAAKRVDYGKRKKKVSACQTIRCRGGQNLSNIKLKA